MRRAANHPLAAHSADQHFHSRMDDSLQRLSVALAARYRIEGVLGAGGMATVYLAEDLKHHRKVALKVLRPDLSAALGSERFLKEIEVTAGLQHHNILPLYDSGEADSFLYYVMPYVEGETLRAKLDRQRQLALDEALGIAGAVAEALDYAHRHGVIHRDIKPENILLGEDHAIVSDFGIALAIREAAGPRLTQTGVSIGTPHYMSPEQATGDRQVDARSDVYALGCVLYEMLAGEPPYIGATVESIMVKALTSSPTRLSTLRRAVPRNVEDAVHQSLERVPEDRFATARDFAAALVRPGSGRHEPISDSVSRTQPEPAAVSPRRRWPLPLAAVLLAGLLGWWLFAPPTSREPPLVVMMDSPHPARVYDQETVQTSGTNADVISDLLLDLPIRRIKESIGPSWHRDVEVHRLKPALVVIHFSGFCQEECDVQRVRLRRFMEFFASERTEFLVYSRQPDDSLRMRMQGVLGDLLSTSPEFRQRVHTFGVTDYGPPRWRDPVTANALKLRVMKILKLGS
ncbi:MAG: serine/threonine protein kinase [Gemmatimonadetes bacterium]|nr:serine/threonine protein kinase [Gemmatimonadota bacterium]